MGIVAFIFARGGSKGLPDKNILPLNGKPLIGWSIDQAKLVDRIERIIVSTDSIEIADVARAYGAEVPFIRPADLALDTTPEWHVWQHALNFLKEKEGNAPEVMLSIPTTAPLRLPIDIESCLNEYEKGIFDVVITASDAHRNPYFNMIKFNSDQTVELVVSEKDEVIRRQDAPVVFDITTIAYVANTNFVLSSTSIFNGRVGAVIVPRERAIDIDTLLDFQMAEYLLRIREEKL
jgi:CMP-N-acetylneuraminic acid synthetase